MLPFAPKSITWYRQAISVDNDGKRHVAWERTVLTGCSIYKTHGRDQQGRITRETVSTIIRVPYASSVDIQIGDFIVLEAVSDKLTNMTDLPIAFAQHGYIRVFSVTRNDNGTLKHFKVIGA